jgi:hypothetical protein
MRRNRLIVTTATSAAIAALLLSGCGSESSSNGAEKPTTGASPSAKASPVDNGVSALPATVILEKAKQALKDAESFHYAGKIAADGQELTSDITFDFAIAKGKGAKGILGFGGPLQVIAIPSTMYFQGDEAYYKNVVGIANPAPLKGKWVQADPKVPDLMIPDFVTTDAVVENILTPEPGQALTKVGPKLVGGTQAVGLSSKDGTLWIATTGAPYPLQVVATGGSKGSVTFDHFNSTVDITPPATADIVPFKKYLDLTTQ